MVLFVKALVVIAKASTYTAVCLKKGAIIYIYHIYCSTGESSKAKAAHMASALFNFLQKTRSLSS